jgi:ribosome-binding protein aMBF1 (putative translation factor)
MTAFAIGNFLLYSDPLNTCRECARTNTPMLPIEGKPMLAELHKSTPEEAKEHRATLGLWLKSLREAEGLSQRELADRLKLDYYTFISQLENGRGKIPAHRYAEWAKALGQEPKSFVRELLRYYEPLTYQILFEDIAS